MSSRTHTWVGYSGPAPLAPYPAHAAPLDGWDVGTLLSAARDRYLHLADESAWEGDEQRRIARHMAAGVKLCLGELEQACQRALDTGVDLRACCDHPPHQPGGCAETAYGTTQRCDCDGDSPTAWSSQ